MITHYDRHVFYITQMVMSHIKVTIKCNIYSPSVGELVYTVLLINFQSHSSSRHNLLLGIITVPFGSFNLNKRTLPSFDTYVSIILAKEQKAVGVFCVFCLN